MKKVLSVSLKGGVGKTKVTAELAKALQRRGLKVGVLDCDFHAPNIPVELHCEGVKPTRGTKNRILPAVVDGLKVLSWAMLWPPDSAVMIEDSQVDKEDLIHIKELIEKNSIPQAVSYLNHLIQNPGGAVEYMRLLLAEGAVDWGDTEWVVVDTPPQSTGVIEVVLESEGVKGAIIVCHASTVSVADTRRLVDQFRKKGLPLLGLVCNQSTQNGQNRYDLTESDIRAFCADRGIPFIAAIPHSTQLASYFDPVAQFVLTAQPVILPQPKKEESWKETIKDLSKMTKLFESLKSKV